MHKKSVFWRVTLRSLGSTYRLHFPGVRVSKFTDPPETSVNFYHTAQLHNLEDGRPHGHCRENPKSRTLCNTPWKYPPGTHYREGCTRPKSGLDTATETVFIYRDSNPHLPAVSPYSTQECIAPLTYITVTIQFSLPAVTRNELAWGIKIPCTSRERYENLSCIRPDGGTYKDQCLPGCDAV
jgi:hypothetical protein